MNYKNFCKTLKEAGGFDNVALELAAETEYMKITAKTDDRYSAIYQSEYEDINEAMILDELLYYIHNPLEQ